MSKHCFQTKRGVRLARACGVLLLGMGVLGCASSTGQSGSGDTQKQLLVPGASPDVSTDTSVTFAGARCDASGCRCRVPGKDEAETSPPSEGSKRFEVRMAAGGGIASLDMSGLGKVASSGPTETCVYFDVPAGSQHDVRFVAREASVGRGIAPVLKVAEYGPKGPYWYDVVNVLCDAPDGKCDRASLDQWAIMARQRQRGRIDPCGSAVVSRLTWETSGGQIERDGGLFRDLTVSFAMEVKKFATQYSPGSMECVPK